MNEQTPTKELASTAELTNDKNVLKDLHDKIDMMSKKLDLANSRLAFLEQMVRTNVRVDQMPLSQGWRRLAHKAGGKLLQFVDIVCRDHQIPYWLYAGSLIGAKLYKHAVPWDDDWDIGMLRKDYEKFREICFKLFEGSEHVCPTFLGFSIQFRHKKFPIYGDVFPFDSYYEEVSTPSQMKQLEEKLKRAKKETPFSLWHWDERVGEKRSMGLVNEDDYQKTKDIYDRIIMENKEPAEKGALLENPLVPGTKLNNVYKYEWIFPLKEIEYEGVTVSCPNDVDSLLAQKFGDILDLPVQLEGHGTVVKAADVPEIEKFLKQDMGQLYDIIKEESNYQKCR